MTLLEPDRDQIKRFVGDLLRHAGIEGFVSVRAFPDNGNAEEAFRIQGVPLAAGLDYLTGVAEDNARRAANEPDKIVFAPPLGVFNNKKTAREVDLIAGLVLSVDCDQHPRRALATLSAIIGPPTVIVRSGGQWTDPETGEVQDKLHLHWRLAHPAQGDDLPRLKQARALAARIVDGDESNVPIGHPIRWPGSWHRKGEPVLCEIEDADPDREIDLSIALDLLKAAGPAPQPVNGDWTAPGISQRAIAGRGQILSSFDSGGESFFKNVNSYALENLDRWVPDLFGKLAEYQPNTGAYRISSKALGRNLQEDLSISPRGIKDWGVWDMGDPRMGKRTPIDLVLEFGARQNAKDAALWLCERTGVSAESLGWGRSSGAQQNVPGAPSIVPPQVADAPDPLREMNNEYCVLLDGGKSRVLTFEQTTRRVDGKVYVRHVPTFLAFEDFRNLHLHRVIPAGDKFVPVGHWWLKNPARRQYAGVIFEPCGPGVVDDRFNLWRGWGVEPKPGDWSKMREHIKHVLANGDTAADTYIINWLAWLVQYPAERAEVVLVFRGKRGTGKGTLGNCLMRLFGQHAVHISSADHLVGRFNAHLRDACFLFADEAYWPGDKRAEGALKRLITEEQLFIEAKGRDGTSVPNMLHVLMASNEDWIVPAGEHERRFAVFEVSERHLQDEKWFDPIYQQLENGGHAAMLHDLLQHKLGNWHPRRFPRTAGLLDQQKQSLGAFDAWWVELLETGELEGAEPEAPYRAVSNAYDEETPDGNYTRTVKHRGLYDQARSVEPRLRNRSDHALGHYLVAQGCENKKVMRRRGWEFPELSVCRKGWEKRFPRWQWRDPLRVAWSEKQEEAS